MNQELLGQFDDGAVGPTDVTVSPTLSAQPRNDVDDQVDLIGQQWVECDEGFSRQFRQLNVGADGRVL